MQRHWRTRPVVAHNTNRQGANFELDVMHYLAGTKPDKWGPGFGYTCLRSSGSKGKIDVLAIPQEAPLSWERDAYPANAGLLFIQCKITATPLRSPLSPTERMHLMDLALRANALALTASKALDIVTGRVRPHFRQLTGPGARDWLPWEPGEDS